MSDEFNSVPLDTISDYLEGFLPEDEEKDLFLKVNTVEDLWALAQMTSTINMDS